MKSFLPWIALAAMGVYAMGRFGRRELIVAGGAAAQFAGVFAADLAAVTEVSGQVIGDNRTNTIKEGEVRELGLAMADAAPRARRAGWAYLYLISDEGAGREAAACVDAISAGARDTIYLDPEYEALNQGDAGRRRLMMLIDVIRDAHPRVRIIYQGLMAILTTEIVGMVDGVSPMCYPIGADGPITGNAGQEMIARIVVDRLQVARDLGAKWVAPTVFSPGHPNGGGPSLALLERLMRETKPDGLVCFTMTKLTQCTPLSQVAAVIAKGR